jgi:hypothetical protein
MHEKRKNLAISIQTSSGYSRIGGGSETIIGITNSQELANGIVHSFWKQKVQKKLQAPVQFGATRQFENFFIGIELILKCGMYI